MAELLKISNPSLTQEEKQALREKIKKFSKIKKENFNKIYNVFERYFEEKKYENLKGNNGFKDNIKILINLCNEQKISKDLGLKSDGKFTICFNGIIQSLLEKDSLKAKHWIYETILDSTNHEDDELRFVFVKFLDDKWLKCDLFEGLDFLIEE